MTSERSQAYGRVMKALADLSASKFHPHEQEAIREAADALLFCEDLEADTATRDALRSVWTIAERLVAADRLMPETAERMLADLEACGPLPVADPVA